MERERRDHHQMLGHASSGIAITKSESRQALRAVVGNLHAAHFLKRAIRLRGVANELRGVAVNLVEIRVIRAEPTIGRAAGHGSVEPPGGAVSRNLWASRIAGYFEAITVDPVAADVAVAEVRRIHHFIIR